MNEVFSYIHRRARDTLVVDLEEFGSVMSRGVMPFITPKLCQNFVDFDGVTRDDIVIVFDGSNRILSCREGATNGGKLVSSSFGAES